MIGRPMLGVQADPTLLRFPLLASRKLDGFRCRCIGGAAMSRTNKLIPNAFVQRFFQDNPYIEGYDGELIVGAPFGTDVLNRTSKGVTRIEGEPDFSFYVFDRCDLPAMPFKDRIEQIKVKGPRVHKVTQVRIEGLEFLNKLEEIVLEEGYEGLILRDPNSLYKQGRSTLREQGMLKIKQFEDAEAEIISSKELMHNGNEAELDERGYTKRSTQAAGKSGLNTLGAWHVVGLNGPWQGVEFDIGSGFTAEQRTEFWAKREEMVGQFITFKYFKVGCKDKPRHPIFKTVRPLVDM